MALVDFCCYQSCGEEPDTVIYKVDTTPESARNRAHRMALQASLFRPTGPRARLRTKIDDPDQSYRREKGAEWTPLPKSSQAGTISGARFADDNNTVYALVTDVLEPAQAYRT